MDDENFSLLPMHLSRSQIYLFNYNKELGCQFYSDINDDLRQALNRYLKDQKQLIESEIQLLNRWYKLLFFNDKNITGLLQDITDYKNEINHFEGLICLDSLTGVINGLGLRKMFDFKEVDEGTLFFIDLDNFKSLNDYYGHSEGDAMLKLVAESLSEAIPGNAMVARISGDEFVIFIPDLSELSLIHDMAQTIFATIIGCNDLSKIDDVVLSASMGVAIYPNDANNFDDLISKADIAMYMAKKRGKANYLIYNNEINLDYNASLEEHEFLLNAFRHQEFQIKYQPIYNIKQQKIEAFEIWPYWQHPTKGLIEYESFLDTLYEEGFCFMFEEWMLNEAVRVISSLSEQLIDIKLTVNISPKHLMMKHFPTLIETILNQYGVYGSSLQIEMNDDILKEDFHRINDNFNKLRDMDIRITIDGLGINNLTIMMLKTMCFDQVKVHSYFTETLYEEESSEIIIDTIISLSRQYHKLFIANGVITESQYRLLKLKNCDYAQGEYLSIPKPLDEIIAMIKRATVI